MSSGTDFLGLSGHEVFQTLRETVRQQQKDLRTAQNLLVIKDDVVFGWDFQSNCVLTLNVKAARAKPNERIDYQTLLPTQPPLFTPNLLIVNDGGTLLAVCGSNGILVLELPHKCPPHGSFIGSKVVYCRSHSLDERLLAYNIHTEVRQVRFHPGSINDTHIVALTSDNVLRFYKVEHSTAECLGAYKIGRQPMGFAPGTNRGYLESLGDTAVDFDFGPPEIARERAHLLSQLTQTDTKAIEYTELELTSFSAVKKEDSDMERTFAGLPPTGQRLKTEDLKRQKWNKLRWPIYLLRGDGTTFVFLMNLYNKSKPEIRGPLNSYPESVFDYSSNSCSILCLKTNPPVLCCAKKQGLVSHYIVLPAAEDEVYNYYKEEDEENLFEPGDRTLYCFEHVELELGLATVQKSTNYYCPIFLHRDESNVSRYFATHNTGVHCVTIRAIDDLQRFIVDKDEDAPCVDLLKQPTTAEYLLCTKTASSNSVNPVIGFTLYYDPVSVLSLLSDTQLISLSLMNTALLPCYDDFESSDLREMNSPLKKMLREPFDLYIQKILQRVNTQPILKMAGDGERTPQECYELLLRASGVIREEYFRYHDKAREEIEKRTKTLQMLKGYQEGQVENMRKERLGLKERAEMLAEKYEDVKEKQEELAKRSEKLLIAISQRKVEPSDAENKFVEQLKVAKLKVDKYQKVIEKVRNTQKYNELHMANWKQQNDKKRCEINPVQTETIKNNLQDTTIKIGELMQDIKHYKKILNIQ